MAKPGGGGNAKPKPKYEGKTFSVAGLNEEDTFLVCGAANGQCLQQLHDNSGAWAMSVVLGGQGADLAAQKQWLINRSGGWPNIAGARGKFPTFAEAMDNYINWRQTRE